MTGDVRRKEIRDEDKEENRRGNGMGHKENVIKEKEMRHECSK